MDATGMIRSEEEWQRINQEKKASNPNLGELQIGLKDVVTWPTRQTYPTPNRLDSMGPRSSDALARAKTMGGCSNLKDRLPEIQRGGQLNPEWVEWLMGWPIGWTALEPLAMDRYRSWLQQHGGF
jgi:hypothetical protein